VGVSNRAKHVRHEEVNFFLKHFPENRSYTGLGVENLSGMDGLYPAHFVTYDGTTFPFPDQSFDWIFSNAVIEHVHDPSLFLSEMLRVGKRVFFTTPNKYFPIELHTNLLFVHWNDRRFDRWKVAHGRAPRSINLLSFDHLRELMERSGARYEIIRNKVCGLTMTFTVVASGVRQIT
jgi:SAM-dependent methyltransferase